MKQRILVAVVGIPALLAVLCVAPAWATALLLTALSVAATVLLSVPLQKEPLSVPLSGS